MNEQRGHSSQLLGTGLGLAAIFLWGTCIAFSRSLIEQLGVFTAGACVHLIGGGAGLAWTLLSAQRRRQLKDLPCLYVLGAGSCFVIYLLCFYLTLGLAADRRQVVEAGIVNYLWPSLTLALSILLLGKRAGKLLFPGMVLAFTGAILGSGSGVDLTWAGFIFRLRQNPAPYGFALVCAITWALYNNLARRWGGTADGGAAFLFLTCAGGFLLVFRCLVSEQSLWTPTTIAELLYTAAMPTCLAYAFWDTAMRKGNVTLVTSVSYGIPLLSTAVSGLYLDIILPLRVWLACGLVVAGAVLCKWSFQKESKV